MGKTLRELSEYENHRLAANRAKLVKTLARERARNEIMHAMIGGKLQAEQVSGDMWIGKVPYMPRKLRFSLRTLVALRAEQLS